MYKKKIKIFLGAFLNSTNAQNINCLALSKYLDNKKFIVYSMQIHSSPYIKTSAKTFNCFFPFRVSKIIGFIWGVLKCDVLYLPKHHDTPVIALLIANLCNKKIFTTIEANMCDENKSRSMVKAFGGIKKIKLYFKRFNHIFPISKYVLKQTFCVSHVKNKILSLGVDHDNFKPILKRKVSNIVFIGTIRKEKGIFEYIKLASLFPDLVFNVIGHGNFIYFNKEEIPANVIFHGPISNNMLWKKLNNMDLHVLLSRNEGFPKVILETAASSIPSIVYSDYGADEWIQDKHSGFIVSDFSDVVETLNNITKDSFDFSKVSTNTYNMSLKYNWKEVIKDWELEIRKL